MVEVINLKKGNYGFNLQFTILEDDGTVKNLDGITPVFKLKKVGEANAISRNCTVTNSSAGVCVVAINSGDLADIGVYNAEIELTSTGYVEDTKTFIIKVEDTVS